MGKVFPMKLRRADKRPRAEVQADAHVDAWLLHEPPKPKPPKPPRAPRPVVETTNPTLVILLERLKALPETAGKFVRHHHLIVADKDMFNALQILVHARCYGFWAVDDDRQMKRLYGDPIFRLAKKLSDEDHDIFEQALEKCRTKTRMIARANLRAWSRVPPEFVGDEEHEKHSRATKKMIWALMMHIRDKERERRGEKQQAAE